MNPAVQTRESNQLKLIGQLGIKPPQLMETD